MANKKISLKRIMAAAQADDLTGFCKACGAESHGHEPDARNQQCESCGEHRVFGAEEMLFEWSATSLRGANARARQQPRPAATSRKA
jgi:hypothetical protein